VNTPATAAVFLRNGFEEDEVALEEVPVSVEPPTSPVNGTVTVTPPGAVLNCVFVAVKVDSTADVREVDVDLEVEVVEVVDEEVIVEEEKGNTIEFKIKVDDVVEVDVELEVGVRPLNTWGLGESER